MSLRPLLAKIAHRGTSLAEIGGCDRWAIGANRLPIVGRDHGRQPLRSPDGSVHVVFNGEIYNYRELRRNLEQQGYPFNLDTDTEVISHGYHCWGSDLFEKLDGMFAIIIYDQREGAHVVARDPMGVKPLYYLENDNGAFYASEIKALLTQPGEITAIPPGHFQHSVRGLHPYSRQRTSETPQRHGSLKSHADEFRTMFQAAVRKRVETDLPVAVFLSGGIDSSAVMYEVAKAHPNVVGFSIGSEDGPDVVAARRLCADLDLKHHHIPVTAQTLLGSIPDVIWTIESFEPNHIRGGTLSYILSREVARAGYKIALCGEGADELFGGYAEVGSALTSGLPKAAIEAIMARFVNELHRTQLQRVDRTSMRFALEVREPFLDQQIIAFADSLPLDHKIALKGRGRVMNKRVLREAYRDVLPDWLVDRSKAVLSLGAGFGSNGPEGMFYHHAHEMVSQEEFLALRNDHPEFDLSNREEGYYFRIFKERFGALSLARNRPLVNATLAEVQ